MTKPIIQVTGLSKRYRLGKAERYKTLRESLMGAIRKPLERLRPIAPPPSDEGAFWALRDVSFDVQPGEVLGIIGRNGAGKSTLLKILSRITDPTEGRIEIHGRVGSLLEVGTGFHPELTGRENVFMNGAILGMKRADIRRQFDEIVAFAEVERFIDTPVKHYSSGMYMRLAFAVAAHLEPEILVIDEVLAVGDAQFQRRCVGRMSAVAEQGRTVLFVSHNMPVMNSLCTAGILLRDGIVAATGAIGDVTRSYLDSGPRSVLEKTFVCEDTEIALISASIIQPGNTSQLITSLPLMLRMRVRVNRVSKDCFICGFTVNDLFGSPVFSSYSGDRESTTRQGHYEGEITFECTVPSNFLNDGSWEFVFDVGLANRKRFTRDEEHRLQIDIRNIDGVGSRFGVSWRKGGVLPMLEWNLA